MCEASIPSILTSGLILVVCGYTITILSSIPAISEVGHLVGRGALLSMFFVTILMPRLLTLIDPFITKTFKERLADLRSKRAAGKQKVKDKLNESGARI